MSTFTPPAQSTVPPVLLPGDPAQTPQGFALFRYFRSRPEGINVYYLSDGTVTENDPDGTTVFWAASDVGRTTQPYVAQAWYGGHDAYALTSAQATALTAAGYTVDA